MTYKLVRIYICESYAYTNMSVCTGTNNQGNDYRAYNDGVYSYKNINHEQEATCERNMRLKTSFTWKSSLGVRAPYFYNTMLIWNLIA